MRSRVVLFSLVLAAAGCTALSTLDLSSIIGSAIMGSFTGLEPAGGGDAAAEEQYMLELINRARANPDAEAARLGLAGVGEGALGQIAAGPKPPLAMNSKLSASARGHAQDMLSRNYFSHYSPEGGNPLTRAAAQGYSYMGLAENIAIEQTYPVPARSVADMALQIHNDLFVDAGIAGREHRVNLLDPNFREIGLGVRTASSFQFQALPTFAVAQELALATDGAAFVLGVVYDDRNGNSFYDVGEGLAATVRLNGTQTTTPASGGYVYRVSPGTYPIEFAVNDRTWTGSVVVSGPNRKVDLITGVGIVGGN